MSRFFIAALAAILLVAPSALRAQIKPSFLMDIDPELKLPDRITSFTRDFKGVWIQALERPEIDLQRMAADTVAAAHKHGIPDLVETVPVLEKILAAPDSHPSARFAAARALIVLDSRSSAGKLLHASQNFGSELRQLVEPAMADWDFAPAKTIWTNRISTTEVRQRDLVLALRGLGKTRETVVLPDLLKIVLDTLRTADVRLEAAAAAGQLADSGLETDASALAASKRPGDIFLRVCALRLLSRHSSETARQLLGQLAVDTEPSVASAALHRLNEIDPALVLPFVEQSLQNADPLVRDEAISAYLSLPNPSRMRRLGPLLGDSHPDVRAHVREGFYRLADQPDLSEPIRSSAMEVLVGQRWQGHEEAALLLGTLDFTPASMRLVELLDSPRGSVMLASAWALRKLSDRKTIPGILDKISRQTVIRKTVPYNDVLDMQVAHLFEACGRMRAKEATPLLLQYVPKDLRMGHLSRSAAIWVLGWLNAGVPDKPLSDALLARALDTAILLPESDLVKQHSVIALARMKAVEHAPAIRNIIAGKTPHSYLGLGVRWAVKELTGEELPEPVPEFVGQGVWFLEPLPARESPSTR